MSKEGQRDGRTENIQVRSYNAERKHNALAIESHKVDRSLERYGYVFEDEQTKIKKRKSEMQEALLELNKLRQKVAKTRKNKAIVDQSRQSLQQLYLGRIKSGNMTAARLRK